jgi:hypothetical protein
VNEVIVLSSTYQVIGKASIERAICILFLQKGYALKNSDNEIKSVNQSIPIPTVIVMPDAKYVNIRRVSFCYSAVKRRDKYKCVYCGSAEKRGLTIDHIIPKRRWEELKVKRNIQYSLNSFQNCVTACLQCNQWKSDHLLSELGWQEVEAKEPLSTLDIDWQTLLD